jgi:hypothetical protein
MQPFSNCIHCRFRRSRPQIGYRTHGGKYVHTHYDERRSRHDCWIGPAACGCLPFGSFNSPRSVP